MNVNFCFIQFLVTLLFSVLNDILCLSLYEPRGYNTFQPIGKLLFNPHALTILHSSTLKKIILELMAS